MKRIIKSIVLGLIGAAALSFFGCSAENTVNRHISLPEQYSITYEVESGVGTISTVRKIVDSEGNTYFQDSAGE